LRGAYLIVDEGGPEAGGGALVRVGGEDGRAAGAGEGLVEVLDDDLRLGDRPAAVDKHGDFPVHGVGLEEERALVEEVLLDVLVAEALEVEHDLHPVHVGAVPHAQQLQVTTTSIGGRHCQRQCKLDRSGYYLDRRMLCSSGEDRCSGRSL